MSGFLTHPITSDVWKYSELANRETSREKYRCSSNIYYIPLSFPSVSHVYSSAELSFSTRKTLVPFTLVTCHSEYPPPPRHSLDSCVTV